MGRLRVCVCVSACVYVCSLVGGGGAGGGDLAQRLDAGARFAFQRGSQIRR